MQLARHTGLHGKARRVREITRASRLYSQRLIDEYLEPESLDGRLRYVPVRSRNDFLPSAAFALANETATAGSQLRFVLDADETTVAVPVSPQPRAAEASQQARGSATKPVAARPRPAPFKPMRRVQTPARFSAGRFLLGCAMGSAAAAVVLLVLSVAIG